MCGCLSVWLSVCVCVKDARTRIIWVINRDLHRRSFWTVRYAGPADADRSGLCVDWGRALRLTDLCNKLAHKEHILRYILQVLLLFFSINKSVKKPASRCMLSVPHSDKMAGWQFPGFPAMLKVVKCQPISVAGSGRYGKPITCTLAINRG